MRVVNRGLAGCLLIVVLAGCGQAAGTSAPESGGSGPSVDPAVLSPSSTATTPDVACPLQEPRHLSDDDADASDAYICLYETRAVPGDGVWSYHVVRRVTGGLDALLEVYRTPDEVSDSGTACTLELPDPLVVHLHDDRGTHAVRAPVDICSKPVRQAQSAYASLVTAVVGEVSQGRVQSQLSVDSNCSDRYKDSLAIEWPPQSDDSTPTPLSAPVSACLYRVAADADGMRMGLLEEHRTLTAEQVSAANTALSSAHPLDPDCSGQEHTRFAVLNGTQADATVIALDGCAVSQNTGWWRADDQLRRAAGA